MNTPARILRASADGIIPPRPHLTPRERERRDIILRAGRTLLAEFGRHAISMADFARAIRLSPATIHRHFADLDDLLGTILRDHLMEIVAALGAVPRQAPDRPRALRAAYLEATRTGLGAPIAAHLLLIRDRHLLPPDESGSVEAIRANIGAIIAGAHAELTLALLDTPQIHPSRMEAALGATLAAPLLLGAAPPAATAEPAAAPSRVAPFKPRLRPLGPKPAPQGGVDWPNPSLWERSTPPPARIHGFECQDLTAAHLTAAPRRASS